MSSCSSPSTVSTAPEIDPDPAARRLAAPAARTWCGAEPGGTPLGDRLRAILLTHADEKADGRRLACLWPATGAVGARHPARPGRGKLVLSDRYLLATIVYQGYGSGLNVDSLWTLGRLAAAGWSQI